MALSAGLVFACRPSLFVLTLTEQNSGKLLWMKPVDADNRIFSLQWMHSVELEQWRETFELTDDYQIHLLESRFKAYGAGIPNREGRYFRKEQDWFVESGFDRVFPELPIGVSLFAFHRLIINGEEYPLTDWVNDGDYVTVDSRKISLLQWWKYQFNGGDHA